MTDSDKPVFLQAFNRLAIALREKEPDTTTLRVYFDSLRDLEIEFIVAAMATLTTREWFPKVSDWRAEAKKVERDRMDAQRRLLRTLPQPLCLACDDTGWERVDNGVKPCACQLLRRLEVLGRAPWPVLPESVGEGDPTQQARVEAMALALAGTR